MFCTECGTQIPDGAGFCPKCGKASLKKPDTAPRTNVQVTPDSVYIAPPLPPQQEIAARPAGMKSVNGVWLYEREHTLIKVTAILLLVLGGYSIISSVITTALIPSLSETGSMNFIGIIACIGFAMAEFRCMRWAFIMPMIGRVLDIGLILYDFSEIFGDSDFMYFISIPTIQILMVMQTLQLIFEIVMLVMLILAQRPLSVKTQSMR